MLKLKLQYFGHLMQRAHSLEKTLMLGKIEGKSRSGQQRMRWLDSITDSMDMNLSKLCEKGLAPALWNQVGLGLSRLHHDLSISMDWVPRLEGRSDGTNPIGFQS